MLEMIFAAALVDTVIALPQEAEVRVHEWGVVTFTDEEVVLGSGPPLPSTDTPFQEDWGETVVRAPVVYFYGEPFSGSFQATVGSGRFIETYPEPGRVLSHALMRSPGSSTAHWSITGSSAEPILHALDTGAFSECVPSEFLRLWRRPPSLFLNFEDGSVEKFVYYECALVPQAADAFHPVVWNGEKAEMVRPYDGGLLSFVRTGGAVVMEGGEGTDAMEILCEWAGGSMKTEELQAMWGTWEDWIYGGLWQGDTLLVFPLPDETVERMTRIELITDGSFRIEYSRFYLGILGI